MLSRGIIVGSACLIMALSMSDADEGCMTKSESCLQTCRGACDNKCTQEGIGNMNADGLSKEIACFKECFGEEEECYDKCEKDAKACYEKCNEDFQVEKNFESFEKLIKCFG